MDPALAYNQSGSTSLIKGTVYRIHIEGPRTCGHYGRFNGVTKRSTLYILLSNQSLAILNLANNRFQYLHFFILIYQSTIRQ